MVRKFWGLNATPAWCHIVGVYLVQRSAARLGLGSVVACAVLIGSTGTALAQAAEVPVARQATILARALAYDNRLKERAGASLSIAVVYSAGDAESKKHSTEIGVALRELQKLTLQGLKLSVVDIGYTGAKALADKVSADGIDALYVCTGLDGDVAAIQGVAEQLQILTLGGTKRYVEKGMVLGVFSRDGAPAIFLNLPASKRVGAAFSSDLIRLASVIQ